MDSHRTVRQAAEAYREHFGEAAPVFAFLDVAGLAAALRAAIRRNEPVTPASLAERLNMQPPPDDVEL